MRNRDPNQGRAWTWDQDPHGSARWADSAHLEARGYGSSGPHLLGYLPSNNRRSGAAPVTYGGDRHEMIVAPTRGGKAVSGAVPRLLDHQGGIVVIDPKDGELAKLTARFRRYGMGQMLVLFDPYDVFASSIGDRPAKIDPVSMIDLESDAAFDDAMLIASAIVVPEGGADSHWSAEAESLIAGLILREAEIGGDLAGVRAALSLSSDAFEQYVAGMIASPSPLVKRAGARIDNKSERELSSVISTAQRNTHFLESQKLADSLSCSNFDLGDIGDETAIYIILPARRIRTARGWLRLLTALLINAVTQRQTRPDDPVLFVLEEMAALERMEIVERSFGLMAGYGLQLLGIVQDFTQIKDLYRSRWETFIANSASVQCFGTNDVFTARYLSSLAGTSSTQKTSFESALVRSSAFGDPEFSGAGDSHGSRPLITPDEMMSLHPSVQFIKLAGALPVIGWRPAYFLDRRYRYASGMPLWDAEFMPHSIVRSVDFTKPGFDVGAALEPHLKVG